MDAYVAHGWHVGGVPAHVWLWQSHECPHAQPFGRFPLDVHDAGGVGPGPGGEGVGGLGDGGVGVGAGAGASWIVTVALETYTLHFAKFGEPAHAFGVHAPSHSCPKYGGTRFAPVIVVRTSPSIAYVSVGVPSLDFSHATL